MGWSDPRKAAAAAAKAAPGTGAAAPAASAAPPSPTAGAASPAPLPAVTSQPAAAQAAAQAATTTPPPTPRGGRRAAAAAAAQAAPAAATPAAVTTPATTVASQPAQTLARPIGFLALLTPATPGKTALNVVAEGVKPAGEPNLFPTIYLTGGDTGGSFEFHDMNPEGSNAELPHGRGQGPKGTDPWAAILLGYRYQVLVWPKAYDKNGPKQVPRSRGILPYDEVEATDVVQGAVQVYNFRNRATQDEFDALGHPAMTLELLMYDPHAGIFCVQTTGTYDSALTTGKEILSAFPDGVPQATPVTFIPSKHPIESKTNTWDEHFIQVRQCAVGAEIDQVKASFNQFLQEHGANAELNATIQEWGTFSISPETMANLSQIAGMRR